MSAGDDSFGVQSGRVPDGDSAFELFHQTGPLPPAYRQPGPSDLQNPTSARCALVLMRYGSRVLAATLQDQQLRTGP